MRRLHRFAIVPLLLCTFALAQTTQPGTKPPAFEMSPELRDALNSLDKHISPEVRAGKRTPNERERKLARLMTILLMSERPENAANSKKHVEGIEAADKAVKEQFAKLRGGADNASPEIQQQLQSLERLALESIHLLDFLSRPATFPTTRESQLDLANRLERIPDVLDREEELAREITHQERRLSLMQQVAVMEKSADQPEKLAATRELLAAMDALAAAQAKLDKFNASTRPAK